MKVFISVDWEGIAGIVDWKQESEDNLLCRRLMTGEVNAAIEGAFAAGASEVVVNDSHGFMKNLLLEDIDPKARVITGNLKELSMVQGVNQSMDAAIFIGYHSKMGTCHAVMDHTYSGSVVQEIRVNGRPAGESTLNALVCGYFGVPVVAISGDDSLKEEAEYIGADHIVVKEGISRFSACHLHPTKARQQITQGVQQALAKLEGFSPLTVSQPVTFEIDVPSSAMVPEMMLLPGLKQLAPRTVAFTHDDLLVAFKAVLAAITLAGSVLRG